MINTISVLPIDEALRMRLASLLKEFNSHRVNPVNFEEIEKKSVVEEKESKVIKMEVKKKKASFLEKLFMTEYA